MAVGGLFVIATKAVQWTTSGPGGTTGTVLGYPEGYFAGNDQEDILAYVDWHPTISTAQNKFFGNITLASSCQEGTKAIVRLRDEEADAKKRLNLNADGGVVATWVAEYYNMFGATGDKEDREWSFSLAALLIADNKAWRRGKLTIEWENATTRSRVSEFSLWSRETY